MDIEARRDDRGYVLIANFVDGFALGWKMAVPEEFKDALDIKLTPRIFAKKKEMLWTQGSLYDFHEGDTIHDITQAYNEWGEALKHLKISVQVQFASSSGYVTYETIEVKNNELEIIHQKGKAKPKEEVIAGLVIKKQRIDHGLVRFKVYRPNKEKTAVEECETIECTQDDFVAFLQTGIVRIKENKQVNIFAENT
ncbi:MAG: hypothetical protein KZQ94_10255 [Candidatus Thiodiazotropha sp. (ex Troendleina suluensis)]|nr:hypothetical protein [Candidatus Thiodiazotropha sp. (ex Troendleina suluensis)]